MTSFLLVFVLLNLTVLIHEGGHFLAAKLSGMAVNRFAIGFGPKLFSFVLGETEYQFRLLPLGGFVDIAGTGRPYSRRVLDNRLVNWMLHLNRKKAGERTRKPRREAPIVNAEPHQLFRAKGPCAQLGAIAAGPAANLALGFVLCIFAAAYFGQTRITVPITVARVDDPAEICGMLRPGDKILSIDNTPADSMAAFSMNIAKAQFKDVTLKVERGGKAITIIQPKLAKGSLPRLGFAPDGANDAVPRNQIVAVGFGKFCSMLSLNLTGLKMLVTGEIPLSSVSSAVGIMRFGTKIASADLSRLLPLAIMINIGIAMMNLLPILPLDGGRIWLIVLRLIRRKELSESTEFLLSWGMTVPVMAFSLFLLARDIINLF